jgi:hypothetical protein
MSDDFFPPTIPTAADAPQTRSPLIPLTMNVAPSTEPHQDAKSNAKSTQAPDKLKTKILHLPHPSSLDVLPSPTDKWSTTTHPIKACVVGYLGPWLSHLLQTLLLPPEPSSSHKSLRHKHYCLHRWQQRQAQR